MDIIEWYEKKLFKFLIKREANCLRKHTTKIEKERLNFATLNPTHAQQCIYGQLTGNCFSPRATQLIYKGCPRLFRKGINNATYLNATDFDLFRGAYWSPIESFIVKYSYINPQNNKNLIDYITGKAKKLIIL